MEDKLYLDDNLSRIRGLKLRIDHDPTLSPSALETLLRAGAWPAQPPSDCRRHQLHFHNKFDKELDR